MIEAIAAFRRIRSLDPGHNPKATKKFAMSTTMWNWNLFFPAAARETQDEVETFEGDLLRTLSSGLDYIKHAAAYEEEDDDDDSFTLWTDDDSCYDDMTYDQSTPEGDAFDEDSEDLSEDLGIEAKEPRYPGKSQRPKTQKIILHTARERADKCKPNEAYFDIFSALVAFGSKVSPSKKKYRSHFVPKGLPQPPSMTDEDSDMYDLPSPPSLVYEYQVVTNTAK